MKLANIQLGLALPSIGLFVDDDLTAKFHSSVNI
jgi:hypothetical protein